MGEVFRNVLNVSFQGGVLILAVLALRLILKGAPKRLVCLLWILVGMRLLMPLQIESALSLQPENQVISHTQWQELRDYGQILPEYAPVEQPESAAPVEEGTPAKPAADTPTVDVVVTYSVNWAVIAPYLWLTGAAAMGSYCVISYFRLRRLVREAVKLTKDTYESHRIDTAFILGYLRPRIYIPMGISRENRALILVHEQTHLRHGDHWIKLIGFLALAIHWYNPLVWIGYVCLCRDIELACDQQVIGKMDLEGRKKYSAALLCCSSNRTHFPACPVTFGQKPVRRRILAVLQYRKPGFWICFCAAAAVIFAAVCFLTSPEEPAAALEIPQLQYTESDTARRVAEPMNPAITFSGTTKDTRTDFGSYHFDPEIPEHTRNECVYYCDGVLSRLNLESAQDIVILSDYSGAWTDGGTVYLGVQDFAAAEFGAQLIVNVFGGYANYGAAYGYAEYIACQSGWRSPENYRFSLEESDARDLNWLCFRDEFVSRKEIGTNRAVACSFAADYIEEYGEASYILLLRQSGDVNSVSLFNEALSNWYSRHGLDYQPTEILYSPGGEHHDYLARSFYATFYMPKEWENRHYSRLAQDGNFLHESYESVKLYYETAAYQMEYIQELFGVCENTSDITVEFLLSGTGATWAARNQIQLNYHGYIPRSYLNMMLYRHTELRNHGGSYYEWLYLGLGEYTAQMMPSLYEDEVLLYSARHENRSYSTLEGDWYRIWQEVTGGETDPDVLWRVKWDLLAYYYDRELHNGSYGQISFTAYLADQVGLETLWDYLIHTERECPHIDFARYRTEWEAWLEDTYGQYPKFSEYGA